MRSRPKIELTYWPAEPRPGDTVHFEATLISRSETPVDAVRFRVRGLEERSNKVTRTGKGTGTLLVRDGHCHLDQSLEMKRMVLLAGERRVLPFALVLPEGLPPSWRSPTSSVQYLLDLRVDIPWWPDRTARYELPVRASPRQPEPRPLRVSDAPEGPRGTELSLELGLENAAVELGGVVRGALAVINAEHHRLVRLEVAVLIDDDPAGDTRRGTQEVYRSPPEVICAGAPVEGHAYPFEVRLPGGLAPSFHGALVAVRWHLEARAVVRLGRDLVVGAELDVYAPQEAQRQEAPVGAPRVAPLGSERRTLVWAEVAKRTGLVHDAAQETLTGRAGSVAFEVTLELRGDELHRVASLEWPELGLDLSLTERRWSDALERDLLMSMEPAFDARFAVRARDAAQVRALLSPEVRASLISFERVTLDDGEAQLASRGNGSTIEELEHFTQAVSAAASLLGQGIHAIPAPAKLASTAAAWREEAEKIGGTFRAGDFSIRGARFRGAPVELITRFDEAGNPEATVARVLLASPTTMDPLSADVQRMVTSLSAECAGLRICADAVEATLPTPLAEPARAESLWRALLRLAQIK